MIELQENNNQLKEILDNCEKLLKDKYQQIERILKLRSELNEVKNRLKKIEERKTNSIDFDHRNKSNICDCQRKSTSKIFHWKKEKEKDSTHLIFL